ncbi:MAG: hypothetical protein CVV03_09175 [Firmicutes bacterium HGW-Firmicutes-8]|nr:MAG: hypothetical protein CVV03_09175 [Firmicutes bacterium HGW-Firmicutes-8]
MKPSMTGYSPEQVATGSLEDGKEVVILYVKEFYDQLNHVRNSGQVGYFYSWSHLEDSNTFVLFIYWENKEEVAIVFPPNQHSIVEGMKMPKELIITSTPINMLVEDARLTGRDFFDLSGPVVHLRDVVYHEPTLTN